MEQEAQKTRNQTAILINQNDNAIKVATAQAVVDAATKLQNAKEAAAFQNELQVQLLAAQAKMQGLLIQRSKWLRFRAKRFC